jgi:hypothetical protein
MNRTDHIVELAAECAPHNGKDDRAQDRADESLHRLLWRELDEWCAAHGDTTDVREDVVANDEARRDKEPDETFENIVYDEVAENHALDRRPITSIIDSYLETTMSKSVICTQQNRPNCCLR